jgi:hypothetical protein
MSRVLAALAAALRMIRQNLVRLKPDTTYDTHPSLSLAVHLCAHCGLCVDRRVRV